MSTAIANQQQSATDEFEVLDVPVFKIGVNDYDRSVHFYTTYFGATAIDGAHALSAKLLTWPEASKVMIVLVRDPGDFLGLEPGKGSFVFRAKNVKALERKLRADGYPGKYEALDIEHYKATIMMMHDPDGNSIEIVEPWE